MAANGAVAIGMGRKTMTEVGRPSLLGDLQNIAALTASEKQIKVGDVVTVGSLQLRGTVKFFGTTEFASGEWVGVALHEKAGKNDGSVKGVRYFDCEKEHGLFVRPANVVLDELAKAESKDANQEAVPKEGPIADKVGEKAVVRSENVENTPTQSTHHLRAAPAKVSEIELRQAQQDLAEAMEDHDVDRLRRTLPIAASLGVGRPGLDGAVRVLNFEVQRALCQEMEEVRAVVAQLAETVSVAEARARQAETKAVATGGDAKASAGTAVKPPIVAEQPPHDWIERVGAQLEERVWSGLQRRVANGVTGAVERATQKLLVAVSDFKETSGRSEKRGPMSAQLNQEARCHLSEEEAAIRLQARTRGMLVRKSKPGTPFRDPKSVTKFIVRWWLKSALHKTSNELDILSTRRQHVETLKHA